MKFAFFIMFIAISFNAYCPKRRSNKQHGKSAKFQKIALQMSCEDLEIATLFRNLVGKRVSHISPAYQGANEEIKGLLGYSAYFTFGDLPQETSNCPNKIKSAFQKVAGSTVAHVQPSYTKEYSDEVTKLRELLGYEGSSLKFKQQ